MTHLDDISYSQEGNRCSLRFTIPNILESDAEKIEKILDKWAKRGLKHFLIEKKEDRYKEGFLKKKDIKEITYSRKNNTHKEGFLKRKNIKEGVYPEKKISRYFYHYASITLKPRLKLGKNNYNVRLYLNFPKDKGFKVLEDIIKELN